jgi:hypothetical protein
MKYLPGMESSSEGSRKIPLVISFALVLVVISASILGAALSAIQANKTISNAGSIRGIGVGIYWDSACTNQTSSINWGVIDPGANKTIRVYVRNEGNTATTLSMAAQNWNPSAASSYLSLRWNYASQTLSVNQVLQIRLTLIVSRTISGITSFSFDITITATG